MYIPSLQKYLSVEPINNTKTSEDIPDNEILKWAKLLKTSISSGTLTNILDEIHTCHVRENYKKESLYLNPNSSASNKIEDEADIMVIADLGMEITQWKMCKMLKLAKCLEVSVSQHCPRNV